VVVSQDLDELMAISDTIAVMAGGRLTRARPVAETTVEALGRAMGGAHPETMGGAHPETMGGAHPESVGAA
jgi:general nucleoside transport system ATP-binding protein